MNERTRDWDVITGWEKRIAVDFGSLGPSHVRWSDWTWKERDIVARKVHESAGISRDHGPRSRQMSDWAHDNAPIMIEFARDERPMPAWAHADYRPSGVPEYVKAVWKRERPDDPMSPADWAYDPPGPWTDPGEEPAWSARPMEGDFDPNPAAPTAAAAPQEGYIVQNMEWLGDKLVLPVTDIGYPEGKDELLCMVESKDPTRGGWATMSVMEALGSGADYTEAVRDAESVHFVVPLSYNIQDHAEAAFKLYWRKANGGQQRPDYIDYVMAVPPMPGPRELDESGGMHSKFGGVITYRTAANGDHIANDGTVISTAESRAKEDVPDWRKFELGRLEEVDGIILPGPNALPQDEERFGSNRLHSKRHKVQPQQQQRPLPNPGRILPDDPVFTPMQKAISWSKEVQHGQRHQERWGRVAAALGADNGHDPMTYEQAEVLWERFGRNARWTMALDAIEEAETPTMRDPIEDANRYRAAVGLPPVEKSQGEKLRDALVKTNEREDVVVKEFNPATGQLEEIRLTPEEAHKREMDIYHCPVAMQGSFTVDQWMDRYGVYPTICYIEGIKQLTILDPKASQPNWWLDGDGVPIQQWRQDGAGGLTFVGMMPNQERADDAEKTATSARMDRGPGLLADDLPPGDMAGGRAMPHGGDGGAVAAPPAPTAPLAPTAVQLGISTPADMAQAIVNEDWVTVAKLAMQKV